MYDNTVIGAPQVPHRELTDPNWRRYFDILKANGVNGLSTAEASGINDPYSKLQSPVQGSVRTRQPGYFDMQGLNPPQQASLWGLMKAGQR